VTFFSVKMGPELRQRLRVAAALAGVSGGEYVRRILEREVPKDFTLPDDVTIVQQA
jgi:predicted DNA-binding protein